MHFSLIRLRPRFLAPSLSFFEMMRVKRETVFSLHLFPPLTLLFSTRDQVDGQYKWKRREKEERSKDDFRLLQCHMACNGKEEEMEAKRPPIPPPPLWMMFTRDHDVVGRQG